MTRRTAAALVAVAVLLVAGVVWVRVDVAGSAAALREAEAGLADERGELAALEAQRQGVLATRRAAQQGAAASHARADELGAAATQLHGEAEALRVESLGTGERITAAEAALVEAQDALASRSAVLEQIRRCLVGVQAAAAAARAGDTVGAVGLLREVVEPCRATQARGGNLVHPYDFADPAVVVAGGRYYAYATNATGGAVQLITSTDLAHWEPLPPALTTLPAWATPGATWAPAVATLGGRWVLYYTVRHAASRRQCISVAVADHPAGPFVDSSAAPLVCELDGGGSIDPSPFVAPDGVPYLLWKREGEVVGGRAELRAQQLTPDGLALVGEPSVLAGTDQRWEGRTVEGPSMLSTGVGFLLLYSANVWNSAAYTIGGALCDTPLGPCRKVGPLLGTAGGTVGPGGPDLFVDAAGHARIAFHAWLGDQVGYPNPRYLHIGTVGIEGGRPVVRG